MCGQWLFFCIPFRMLQEESRYPVHLPDIFLTEYQSGSSIGVPGTTDCRYSDEDPAQALQGRLQ